MLLEHYRPRLLGFIQQLMSRPLQQKVGAEDVLQEVCISCMHAFPEIDLSDRDPFDWVCQMARRRIMDAGRKFQGTEKRAMHRELGMGATAAGQADFVELLVASITTPSRAFSREQREFVLQQALEQLPTESQDALRMRYVEQLSSKEIAARLGKSDGAVRVLLTRSLKKLQDLMGEEPTS